MSPSTAEPRGRSHMPGRAAFIVAGIASLALLGTDIAAEAGPAAAVAQSVRLDARPAVRDADCLDATCDAKVILVEEGGLLERMREWRTAPRASSRQHVRRTRAERRSSARRGSQRASARASARRSGSREPAQVASGATFTTMCVRSCDGYFFPISFSTTEDRFASDKATCEARCPGMEVNLYVHKVLYESSDQMKTIEGTPYSDLKNAFLYKLKGPQDEASCGCRVPMPVLTPAALPDESERADLAAGLPSLSAVPLPRWRPDPNAAAAIETATLDEPAREKAIRVVGPAFFPDR